MADDRGITQKYLDGLQVKPSVALGTAKLAFYCEIRKSVCRKSKKKPLFLFFLFVFRFLSADLLEGNRAYLSLTKAKNQKNAR